MARSKAKLPWESLRVRLATLVTCPCRRGSEGLDMAKTKQTLFVIFASPQQHMTPATCYIAQNASTTMMSSKAARFSSFADIKAFAKEHHLALTARTYTGLKDFIDVDFHG
jgi:hypothetical protein